MFRVNDLLQEPDDLFAGQGIDIKYEDTNDTWVVMDGQNVRVWDGAKYGKIVDRFNKNEVNYVIVMFDAPGNPPSNSKRYVYLAP